MSKRPFIAFGVLAAVCLILIPFFALGKEGDSDAGTSKIASADVAAKELFESKCGYCHTLAAAGTDGVVGPNLDELLITERGSTRAEQFEGTYSRVLQAVTCGDRRADAEAGSCSATRRSRWRRSPPPTPARSATARPSTSPTQPTSRRRPTSPRAGRRERRPQARP